MLDGKDGLSGCRVVVTRPTEQAEELAGPLRRLGALVRVRPLVGIAPPADPGALRAAIAALDSYRWLAFTSANAVRACAEAAPPGTRWPAAGCVGPGTARAAAAAGIPVLLVPEVFSGEGLARAMAGAVAVPGARVLWPRASGAREDLGAGLRAAGVVVDEVECYRTVPSAAAAASLASELEHEPADVLVFTSPSAVRTLAAAAGGGPGCAVAVIGESSAAAAAEAGWPVQVRPVEQSIPGLLGALTAWWGRRHG